MGAREDEDVLSASLKIATDLNSRIEKALETAKDDGTTDGSHHKMWVIDQMVRALTGDKYSEWVAEYCKGEDGPETYSWDEGIAP